MKKQEVIFLKEMEEKMKEDEKNLDKQKSLVCSDLMETKKKLLEVSEEKDKQT